MQHIRVISHADEYLIKKENRFGEQYPVAATRLAHRAGALAIEALKALRVDSPGEGFILAPEPVLRFIPPSMRGAADD